MLARGRRPPALTSLSEFVGNLEASGYFKRSIEILNSVTETMPGPPGELIKFSIKAEFTPPSTDVKPPTAAKVGG